MTTLPAQQLKNVSLDFRNVASRYLRSDSDDAIANLRRLIAFLDETPLLADFIASICTERYEFESIIEGMEFGDRFEPPADRGGEISYTYQLLRHIATSYEDMFSIVAGYVRSSNKIQDNLNGFNRSVVQPFINHLTRFLETELQHVEGNQGGDASFHIGSVQQLNVAQGGSNIVAINQGSSGPSVEDAAKKLIQSLDQEDIPQKDREAIKEITECICDESKATKPKRNVLAMCLEKLPTLLSTAKVGLETVKAGHELLDAAKSLVS